LLFLSGGGVVSCDATAARGFNNIKVSMWLANGGANATMPLQDGKKLADYGLGPGTSPMPATIASHLTYHMTTMPLPASMSERADCGVTIDHRHPTRRCKACWIGFVWFAAIVSCGFCCWGCYCFRSGYGRRRCIRCLTCHFC
jgi:hypothetical protein